MNGKEKIETFAPKQYPPKRVIAVDGVDDDDDPPLYHDGSLAFSGYQNSKINDGDGKDLPQSKGAKFVTCLLNMTIEPFMFLYMFSYLMCAICVKTLMMEKGCRHELNFTETVCSNLSGFPDVKMEVEKFANNYSLYSNLIRFIPATLIVSFMGSWSDKYGRKPPLILAVVGVLAEEVGFVLNALYYDSPVAYFMFASIPSALTGGFINVMSISYSLATESTSEKYRTIKFALVELGMSLGMSVGIFTGGIMSKYYSYSTIFSVAAVGHSLAILWALFVIAETRGHDVNVSWKKKLCDVFTVERVVEGFKATIKKRPDRGRCQIWLLLLSICGVVVTYVAIADIEFMYTFHRYGWDNAKFSSVSTLFSILGIFVSVLLVPALITFCKVTDTALGLFGTISMMSKDILIGAAAKPWLFYAGSITGMFSGMGPLAVRSYLSKMLHKDELGKIFAFIAACESLIPVGGALLITKVYNASINVFPGAPFYVATALVVPAFLTFLWLKLRKSKPCEQLLVKGSVQS